MRNIVIAVLLLFAIITGKAYLFPAETGNKNELSLEKRPSGATRFVGFEQRRYLSKNHRYKFSINSITAQIPYASNMTLHEEHDEVIRLILAIHSSSYNPDTYLENSLLLLGDDDKLNKETLIVAPAFYRKDKTNISDSVIWSVSPFWGSSRALYRGEKIKLSAYEILDDILTRIITSKHFKNLSEIIILGHSAGGQLVNRYAASNTIENTVAQEHHVSMRYLVMAPSSYVYLDGKRVKKYENNRFTFPFGANKKYNYWGYGLEHLYGYHKRHGITAETIRFQYQYRKVLYLVGERDTKAYALDKSSSAMREGENRLERLKIYYNYLKSYYGDEIAEYHSMAIIPNAGHSGRVLMSSKQGKKFILGHF